MRSTREVTKHPYPYPYPYPYEAEGSGAVRVRPYLSHPRSSCPLFELGWGGVGWQILGFLLSGVVLSQFGLIRNVTDVKALSELGILFLVSQSVSQSVGQSVGH